MFIVKYDPSGNVVWAANQSAGGTSPDIARGCAADAGGNVFVTGWFSSSSITFGSTTLTNAGAGTNDMFVVKLNEVTGIEENNPENVVNIFPNPFSSKTLLHTKNPFHNATLSVNNYLGQTVEQIKNLSGQTITFTRDNLQSGLYFVQVTEDNKIIAVKKIVITD